MKIRIRVTRKNIKAGIPRNHIQCPIAIAMRDAAIETPSVGEKTDPYCDFLLGKNKYESRLPQKAINFIERFDHGLKVRPFEFFLHFVA